jgi:hypothetical protein
MTEKEKNNAPQPKPVKISKETAKSLQEWEKANTKATKEAKLAAKSLKEVGEELEDSFGNFGKLLQDAAKTMDSMQRPGKAVKSFFDDIEDASKKIVDNMENIGDELYEHVDVSDKVKNINKKIKEYQKKGFKDQVEALKKQKDYLKGVQAAATMMNKAQDIAVAKGIKVSEITEEISKPFEEVISLVDKVPGGGLIRKAFGLDAKLEKVQKQVMSSFTKGLADGKSVGMSAFSALRTGASSFMAALGPILVPLLAIAATLALIKKAFELDQEVSDLAKGLGVSKHEAHEIHDSFNEIAMTTDVIGAGVKDLNESYLELNAITGQVAEVNQDMLETQVLLKKQYGLTGEEAAAFQATSAGLGMTADQQLATVQEMVEGYNAMTGDVMNVKEISKDIAKVSKTTLAAYHGDVKALTLAAIQAKKLGMSMEQTAKISDNLLDIETSIENEMKANVLTGKHMNLNKARELALAGKSAEAAAEAVKQAGDYNEFLKMGPLQQKAIADAAGMTVDELTKAGELQKMSAALGGEEVKDMKDLTAEQINQLKTKEAITEEQAKQLIHDQQVASNQEKISMFTERLEAMFAKVAGPIMEMLGPLFDAVDFLFPLIKTSLEFAFAPIIAVSKIIGGISKMFHGDFLGGIHDIGAAIFEYVERPFMFVYNTIMGFFPSIRKMMDGIFEQIKNDLRSLLPNWALKLLGIAPDATATASTAKAETMHDGVINPRGGMVVSGPEGSINLNEKDSIIAGTNLGGSGNNSNSEVVTLLKELIAKVSQPTVIKFGSKTIEEFETQINMRKSYTSQIDRGYGATS